MYPEVQYYFQIFMLGELCLITIPKMNAICQPMYLQQLIGQVYLKRAMRILLWKKCRTKSLSPESVLSKTVVYNWYKDFRPLQPKITSIAQKMCSKVIIRLLEIRRVITIELNFLLKQHREKVAAGTYEFQSNIHGIDYN